MRYCAGRPRPLPPLAAELFELREDGVLIWKIGPRAGKVAGCVDERGYRHVQIDGVTYKAHRIIWALVHGEEPPAYIDHIDGDKLNNHPENLREATQSQNLSNVKKLLVNNTSGFRGVSWHKSSKKWKAQIRTDGRKQHLGYFTDPIEAARVYDKAAIEAWGAFATTNASLGLLSPTRRMTPARKPIAKSAAGREPARKHEQETIR